MKVTRNRNVVLAAEEAKGETRLFVEFLYADQETSVSKWVLSTASTDVWLFIVSYTILEKIAMYADPLINFFQTHWRGNVGLSVPHEKVHFISREDSAKAIVEVLGALPAAASLQNKTYNTDTKSFLILWETGWYTRKVSGEKNWIFPNVSKEVWLRLTMNQKDLVGPLSFPCNEAANLVGLMDIVTGGLPYNYGSVKRNSLLTVILKTTLSKLIKVNL